MGMAEGFKRTYAPWKEVKVIKVADENSDMEASQALDLTVLELDQLRA